jgi:hypothetical protein
MSAGSSEAHGGLDSRRTCLEREFQCHDDLSIVCGCGPEKCRHAGTGTIGCSIEGGRVHVVGDRINIQVWVVEEIVELGAELQGRSLFRQLEVFHDADVVELCPRTTVGVARDISLKWTVHRDFASKRCRVREAKTCIGIVDLVDGEVEKAVRVRCIGH